MLEVLDRAMRKVAVLENAFERVEEECLNGVGRLTFSLPAGDAKAGLCAPFGFVRAPGGTVYRILSDGVRREEDMGRLTFEAEHAIATLVDDVMFGTQLLGGQGMLTRAVIARILAGQTVERWRLGACEFNKQFEYGFESENLLNALLAVPNLFVEDYRWTFDFSAYPWTVSLRALDAGAAGFDVRAGKNLITSGAARAGGQVCTRLYLLGYGEGDNQLTISDINGGRPYLQSPPEYIERYGLISKVYVDRQFEDAQSLMERGRALLAAMQQPQWARTVKLCDLEKLAGQEAARVRCGDVARLCEDGERAYVTRVRRWLDIDGEMEIEMSTGARDIAADIADIADRQRIEQVYAQGATQIYAQSVQANASPSTAAQLNFYIPREMRIVNKVLAKISLDRFRSYSRVTSGGGRTTSTSSAGGGSATTSSTAGGSTLTTSADGQTALSGEQTVTLDSGVGFTTDASSIATTGEAHPSYSRSTGAATGSTGVTSAPYTAAAGAGVTATGGGSATGGSSRSVSGYAGNGTHTHDIGHTHATVSHQHTLGAHQHANQHTHGLNAHTHPIGGHRHPMAHTHTLFHRHTIAAHSHQIKAHSHRVSVPAHSHGVSFGAHTHSVTVPEHTHEIAQGIFRFGAPKGAKILVNGVQKAEMGGEREIDLTPFLLDGGGKIPRGSWIRLGVAPDDLAYVTIDVVVQGFVQSRGGGTY